MPCRIVVFAGLIASGKSTLASFWAKKNGLAYFNSDRIRKELLSIPVTDRCPAPMGQGIYSAAMTRRTYDALLDKAQSELRSQGGVVLDASYSSRRERDRVRDLARSLGCDLFFVYCWCDEQETERRLKKRAEDPDAVSDGRMEIYQQQKKKFEFFDAMEQHACLVLETDRPVAELARTVTLWLGDC